MMQWVACCWTLVLLTGCRQEALPTAEGGGGEEVVRAAAADTVNETVAPTKDFVVASAASGDEVRDDLWYAFYRDERKFGFAHTTVRSLDHQGQPLVETRTVQQLSLPRGTDTVTQHVQLVTRTTTEGRVVSLESRMDDGGASIVTRAECDREQLRLTVESLGKTVSKNLPWSADCMGFDAEQRTLRERPLHPGETRTVRALLPLVNVLGSIRLEAKRLEQVDTPLGKQPLLRIESQTQVTPELRLDSTLWADATGTIRKSWMRQGDVTAVQTVREVALAPDEAVDLFAATQLRVERPIPQPHQKRRAAYRVRLKSGEDPRRFFASGPSQQVRAVDRRTAEIEVAAVRPEQPATVQPPSRPPGEADVAANALIQHDAPEIRALLEQVAPADGSPWSWAVACERYVHEAIDRKVLSQAFRTAAEVARERQGDCTEHAVLLAALARAHGLPARVVTGLVAYGDAYAFHMWNEVWIDDRWVPLDATLALGGIGAGHLKLSDSNLDGVSPFTALLPVLEIIGQLEIEVVSYQ